MSIVNNSKMSKKFILAAIILIALVVSIVIWLQPTPQPTSHIRSGNTYYFHMGFPKDLSLAVIKGAQCDNLTGASKIIPNRKGGRHGEIFRWAIDWRNPLTGDVAVIEEWKNSVPPVEEKIFCVPYVQNLQPYLSNSRADVDVGVITLEDGPILISEKRLTKKPENVHVSKIFSCGKSPHEFCATLAVQEKSEDFHVMCWDCDRLKSSPQALSDSIIAEAKSGAINNGLEFILDGGHLVSAASFGEHNIGFILHGAPKNSIFYSEEFVGEYAQIRWKRALSLIDAHRPGKIP